MELHQVYKLMLNVLTTDGYNNESLVFIPAPNDSAAFDMIRSGQADFSDYSSGLTPKGIGTMTNLGPLLDSETWFVYKTVESRGKTLDMSNVFPWKAYVMIGVFLASIWLLGQVKLGLIQKALHRATPITGIAAAVLLAYLSSEVVLLFNSGHTVSLPITDFETLVDQIAKQNYQLLLLGPQYGEDYGILNWSKRRDLNLHRDVQKSFSKFPPQIVESFNQAGELVTRYTDPLGLLVVSTSFADLIKSNFCGLTFVRDKQRGREYSTLYYRSGFPMITCTENHRVVIRTGHRKIIANVYPEQSCYADQLQPTAHFLPLGIQQLELVFLMVLIFSGVGGFLLAIGEEVYSRICKKDVNLSQEEIVDLNAAMIKAGRWACLMEVREFLSSEHSSVLFISEFIERLITECE